ncbi:MAG: hypothetical protein L6Q75_00145 [Burkholderiaceae bacterium]|nr:hypothetical protein [Burkholderiaceae bacterium]
MPRPPFPHLRGTAAVLTGIALAACGGGGGGNTTPTPTPTPEPSLVCTAREGTVAPLTLGQDNSAIPTLAKPLRGATFPDPVYGTTLVRLSDHAADGLSGFARQDYSRRQAFNADSSRVLVNSRDGRWHLYDAASYRYLKTLDALAGDAEPQWHPTDPDRLYFLPINGVGMTVHELTLGSADSTRVVGDLAQRLRSRWPTANAAWTKSEGSPSADGRYWCLMVDDAAWQSLGVVTWDRDSDTILGWLDTQGDRPDHVSMSPSGEYCVVSGDSARGTVAYSRDFSTRRKLLSKSEHSDLALDADGRDVYVSVDYQSATGSVFMTRLDDCARTELFSTYVDQTATALHISGKAFRHPGWVVLSTYADYYAPNPTQDARRWLHRKVMAVQLSADPTIRHLAHHRSFVGDYFGEPQASVNRDFTRILFNSDWAQDAAPADAQDIDTYMILTTPP